MVYRIELCRSSAVVHVRKVVASDPAFHVPQVVVKIARTRIWCQHGHGGGFSLP